MAEQTSRSTPPMPMTKVLVWTAIVAVLGIGYALYSGGSTVRAVMLAVGALVTMTIVVFIRHVTWSAQRGRKFVLDQEAATAAVAAGDLEAARSLYEPWRSAEVPNIAFAATHFAAGLEMRLGRMSQAIDLLDGYVRKHPQPLWPETTILLATNHALLGDVDAATTWLDRTPKTVPAPRTVPEAPRTFAAALIDCRAGRCDSAAKLLDERWSELEANLRTAELRPYRILRAFTRSKAGKLDGAELVALKPAYANEHAFLGAAWPEMQQFLAAHALG